MATAWIENGRLKRIVDLIVAVPSLIVLAPVSGIVALGVRMRLGAPVLFRQERAGSHGVPIQVPKFRSMTDARDADGHLLDDELRMTPFGARLRSLSLDELPQLWSIVKGDMSLVGPRPLPMVYVERYDARQVRRLEARPGLTGWAQVHGRNAVEWPERLELDVWYVDHASLRVDLDIVRRTVSLVLGRRGVSADGEATMTEFIGDA